MNAQDSQARQTSHQTGFWAEVPEGGQPACSLSPVPAMHLPPWTRTACLHWTGLSHPQVLGSFPWTEMGIMSPCFLSTLPPPAPTPTSALRENFSLVVSIGLWPILL